MAISTTAAYAATLLFPAAMVYAGVMDLLTMKIRNVLVLGVGIAYFLLAPLAGVTIVDIGISVAVATFVFLVTFGFFAAGWIGGGDAKLATVVALWFGWNHSLTYFAYASIAGGALTLLLIFFRQWPLPAAWSRSEALSRLHEKQGGIPYGAAFALAALLVFPATDWYALAV